MRDDFDLVLMHAAEQFPTKKEQRQYALLQAAAIIYASSEHIGRAVNDAEALLDAIEALNAH